jgi:hypothetical protein
MSVKDREIYEYEVNKHKLIVQVIVNLELNAIILGWKYGM